MSADKEFTEKIPVDTNVDSGFLSGPIDQWGSEDLGPPSDSVKSEVTEEKTDDLELCTRISSIGISDNTPTVEATRHSDKQTTQTGQKLPVKVLFLQDEDGDTQLHIAVAHGCKESVGILIRLCPEKAWLNIQNEYRHTALHLAVMGRFSVIARMLVVAGASLAPRDIYGRTAVHIATESKDVECLKALLAPVIEQPHRNLSPILNQKDYNGQTCVHVAANNGHLKTLQTLVFFGADINAKEGLAGWTALHIAARRGDETLSYYLLNHCAGVAKTARDNGGRTPRRLARRTRIEKLFANVRADTDTESETDDDDDDSSEGETLFERLAETAKMINVA